MYGKFLKYHISQIVAPVVARLFHHLWHLVGFTMIYVHTIFCCAMILTQTQCECSIEVHKHFVGMVIHNNKNLLHMLFLRYKLYDIHIFKGLLQQTIHTTNTHLCISSIATSGFTNDPKNIYCIGYNT